MRTWSGGTFPRIGDVCTPPCLSGVRCVCGRDDRGAGASCNINFCEECLSFECKTEVPETQNTVSLSYQIHPDYRSLKPSKNEGERKQN